MYQSFMIRGAIGFLIGGVFFTQIQSRLPGGIWISMILAGAVFGTASAFALEGMATDTGRPLKRWSAAGWAVGGLLFALLVRLLITRSSSPFLVLAVPAAFTGFFGGMGLGIGWRDLRTGLILGVSSAILLPGSLWAHTYLIQHGGIWLVKIAPMSITWLKICAWVLGLFGFVIYGTLIGLILAYTDDQEEEHLVTAGPIARTSGSARSTIRSSGAHANTNTQTRSSARLASVKGSPTMVSGSGIDTTSAGGSYDEARMKAVAKQQQPPAAEPEKKPERVPGEDEITLSDPVALTPYEDDDCDETAHEEYESIEPPPDMSADGTFQPARRNYHPDYSPGDAASDTGKNKLEILRNYHPAFAPETESDERFRDEGDAPHAPDEPPKHDTLEVDLEVDADTPDDDRDWSEDGEFDFLPDDGK